MKGKLEQGKYYDFKVIKSVSLEERGRFWILEDPFGFRQMLNASYYPHYPIEPGITMICKVDKINCSGKIFLEPPNPEYAEGEVSVFIVDDVNPMNDRFVVDVVDAFGKIHTLVMYNKPGAHAKCRVDRIKKGCIYLSDPAMNSSAWFTESEKYPFLVEAIKPTPEWGECFFLKDHNNKTHILPAYNYSGYGIKKGQTIICTIVKQTDTGRCTLEPEHPHYIPGNQYNFALEKIEFNLSYNNRVEWIIWVSDIEASRYMVIPDSDDPENDFKGCKTVSCVVERIKKGKLYLINPTPVNTP